MCPLIKDDLLDAGQPCRGFEVRVVKAVGNALDLGRVRGLARSKAPGDVIEVAIMVAYLEFL